MRPATVIRTRLAKLERELTAAGCQTCRCYGPCVFEDNGGERSRPERCPDCGRDAPVLVTGNIVGVPWSVP